MHRGFYLRVVLTLVAATVWSVICADGARVSFAQESPSPAPHVVTVVPFDYDPPMRPGIVVHVSINNSPPLPFLLDASGSYSILVFNETADELKLISESGEKGEGAQKKHTLRMKGIPSPRTVKNIPIQQLELVLIQDAKSKRLPITIVDAVRGRKPSWIDEYSYPQIAGVIGGGLLQTHPSCLDFARREWRLYGDSEAADSTPKKGERFPMRADKSLQSPLLQASLMPGSPPIDFALNTAQPYSLLPERMEGVLSERVRRTDFTPANTFISSVRIPGTLLSGIKLNALDAPEMAVGFAPKTRMGILGTEFLERYKITFLPGKNGQQGGTIILEARENHTPRLWGETGLAIEKRPGDRLLVTKAQGAFARQAKSGAEGQVRVGDWLLSVDGTDVEELSWSQIHRQLAGTAGSTAVLEVQTPGSKRRTVRIVRNRASDSVPVPIKRQNTVIVPFEYDPVRCPYIVVRLRLNDGPPLPFIVDTGFDAHLILPPDIAAARKLFVDTGEASINGKLTAYAAYGIRAAFVGQREDAPIEPHYSYVVPWPEGWKMKTPSGEVLAGIVGIHALLPYTVQFDFTRSEMRLLPPGQAPPRTGKETSFFMIPVSEEDKRFYIRASVDNNEVIPLLLDTGSWHTIIYHMALPMDTIRWMDSVVAFTGFGLNTQAASPLLFEHLRLGLAHYEPDVVVLPSQIETDNLLGLSLLSRYNVTLDFVNDTMLLLPTPNTSVRRRQPGTVDLRFGARKKGMPGWPVEWAFVDGAAYRAGIRAGDMLLAIGGTPLRGTDSPEHVAELANGTVGTVAVLTVRKPNGTVRKVQVRRISNVLPKIDVYGVRRVGLTAMWDNRGRIQFDEVSSSATARTGLRDGDILVAFHGKEAKAHTVRGQIAVLGDLFWRGGSLKVMRAGKVLALKISASTAAAMKKP